jgi:hypothetical protein
MSKLSRLAGAAALALALLAQMALPAQAQKIRIRVYNTSGTRVWITMYTHDVVTTIRCSGEAPIHAMFSCEPNFGTYDSALTVRAEIMNMGGGKIGDIDFRGTPRTMLDVTVFHKDGKYRITNEAPGPNTK